MSPKPLLSVAALVLAALACNTPLGAPLSGPGTLSPPATEAAQIVTQAASPTSASVLVPTQAATEAPQPTSAAAGLLPAPLYYINQTDQQIWRMEVDGVNSGRITNEPSPITFFDVSPVDGGLVYVSGNNLILTDAKGGQARTVITGGALDQNDPGARIGKEIGNVHWSPDGKWVAYGLNGINILDAATGQSQVLKQSDPYPDLSGGGTQGARFYLDGLWSPDGSRMLIDYANFPEGGGYFIRSLADGAEVSVSFPDGSVVCCHPSWTADSQAIYFSNDSVGIVSAGLWRVNAVTGAGETLISAAPNAQQFPLVSNARILNDGQLYYFYMESGLDPATGAVVWPPALTLTRSGLDGVSQRQALRTDALKLVELLWAPDGRGAVVVQQSDDPNIFAQGPLAWADSANGPLVDLHASGWTLRWGK